MLEILDSPLGWLVVLAVVVLLALIFGPAVDQWQQRKQGRHFSHRSDDDI